MNYYTICKELKEPYNLLYLLSLIILMTMLYTTYIDYHEHVHFCQTNYQLAKNRAAGAALF